MLANGRLIGSTTFGENNAESLSNEAVAYLNVDVSGQAWARRTRQRNLTSNRMCCWSLVAWQAPGAGSVLSVGATPSINGFLRDGIRNITDPNTGQPLYGKMQRWNPCPSQMDAQYRIALSALVQSCSDVWSKYIGILGSGSDYTVFLARLGIASADLTVRTVARVVPRTMRSL